MVPSDEFEQYPRPRFARYFLLPAAIVIGVAALIAAFRPAREDPAPRRIPSFELPLLGGGTLSSDDLRGDPVVFNLWASWCGPCRREAPVFERLWRTHHHHGLQIVGINTHDSPEDAERFVTRYGITYPIVRDVDGGLVEGLEDISGIHGALPQTFFVTRGGYIQGSGAGGRLRDEGEVAVLGAMSESALESRIAELFLAPSSPRP